MSHSNLRVVETGRPWPPRFASGRPAVMGIVNVTADSFSDGGRFLEASRAIEHGLRLRDEGADLVDIGGESTRPGAQPVPLDEERRRVIPVVEALVREGVAVSVDTMKPTLMREAIEAGCAMVNDVNAFRAEGAVEAITARRVAVCVMHMQGEPATMQSQPRYGDVVAEVSAFLRARAAALEAAGVLHEAIVLDPGFGFGKTLEHNAALFRALPKLAALGYPVLAGLSRKRTLGEITGRPVEERLAASVAAALLAVQNGASFVRVHDVKETVDAIKTWMALR
ncbi:dihydropteroate synthase [Betaproteobacteria bacterium GR16-43]|nr:dihydropteroate synthase [Betaproteobacteria bacterium GR16-43]